MPVIDNTELRDLLVDLQRIQLQINAMENEKANVRASIQELLERLGHDDSYVHLDHGPVGLKLRTQQKVEYDEVILADRLGDRYRHVLAPDPKKIRQHLDEVAPLLESKLDLIGSTSRDRVEDAIRDGLVDANEFRGTFRKTTKTTLYVSKLVKDR